MIVWFLDAKHSLKFFFNKGSELFKSLGKSVLKWELERMRYMVDFPHSSITWNFFLVVKPIYEQNSKCQKFHLSHLVFKHKSRYLSKMILFSKCYISYVKRLFLHSFFYTGVKFCLALRLFLTSRFLIIFAYTKKEKKLKVVGRDSWDKIC